MSRRSVEGTAPARVRRRHVFYLSGFDPKGPSHYHRLYADEAAKAGALAGNTVRVGKRRKVSEHVAGWSVTFDDGAGPAVDTEVEFLRWDDIVRDHWPRHPGVLAWDLVVTTWLYLRTGALWKMVTLSWPPVVALVVPFLILLALVMAVPVAVGTGITVAAASGSAVAGVLAGFALLASAFGLARIAERRLNMQWLLRSYAFTGRQGTQGWPVLEARLDHFAQLIVDRVRQAATSSPGPAAVPASDAYRPDAACDEVLIVAHSSGSIMAVAALARALALDPLLTQHGPRVSLLTLGQWLPLLSSLPSAQPFRNELDRLARDPALGRLHLPTRRLLLRAHRPDHRRRPGACAPPRSPPAAVSALRRAVLTCRVCRDQAGSVPAALPVPDGKRADRRLRLHRDHRRAVDAGRAICRPGIGHGLPAVQVIPALQPALRRAASSASPAGA